MSFAAKRKKHQQCPGSVITHEFIQQVQNQNINDESPQKSMRFIVKYPGVFEATIRRLSLIIFAASLMLSIEASFSPRLPKKLV